jgi:hypothetical protein
MVVKCIKKTVKTDIRVINSNLESYLKIGALYDVYGIRISKEMIYFMIFFDQRHLIEVPIEMFEILDGKVSPHWVTKIWKNNDCTFWPNLFYKEDFFENFSEWEEIERAEFLKLEQAFRI